MERLPSNSLLIADPFLKDAHFQRSVILLCNHSNEGSVGFILNRKFHMQLCDLMSGIENVNMPVYVGGPVSTDSLHFIHQYPHLIPDAEMISEHIFWGGDFEKVKMLLNTKMLDPERIRFFIGYSGWSEGQLEQEMQEKTWLLGEASEKILFHTPTDQIWKESVMTLGESYREIIHYPIDPQLN
jgi:putative transcriptional regulator